MGPYAYVLAMLEQEPDGCGSVSTRSTGQIAVSWSISETSIQALNRSLYKLSAWLGADLHLPPFGIASRLWSGAHHAGTCPISPNAATGVVDSDLRLHDRDRLYACDASVLPSTGASHTGLTIGSLATRLADHLIFRFSGRVVEHTR